MTDIEIIEAIEKAIKIKLERYDPGEIEDILWSDNPEYCLDETGAVMGLNLEEQSINPVLPYLARLKRLTHLNLFGCQLALCALDFLAELPELAVLNLGGNPGIKDYSFLQTLKELKVLSLCNSSLTDVSFLKNLPALETLDLSDNEITDLSFVAHLHHLTELDIDLNPIENPPPEIAKQGPAAIRDYFRSLKKEGTAKKLDEVKILLVGEGTAGKTSLFKRLNNEPFDENEGQTHGVNIGTLPIDVLLNGQKQTIKAHCWDFGGQEIMHASHQFFLSSRSLYILVLNSRTHEKTDYWLKHIASFGGHSPVLIVINKIDENPGFDLDRNSLKQKYPNIAGFYQVSCKDKTGLGAFKQALQETIPGIELLRTPVAASWLHVKEKLQAATAKENYIDQPAFETICKQEKIDDISSRTTLIRFLNELGVVLHFKELALSNFHVLNPHWVTEGVYRIINSPFLAEQKGILDTGRLPYVLNEEKTKTEAYDQKLPEVTYNNPEQLYILSLMKQFELCFRLDDGKILIPDLLKKETPDIDIEERDALRYLLRYDFLPLNVISRFMVRMHRDIDGSLMWRTGVVLQDRDLGVRAVVKADEDEREIAILVSGKRKRDYFSVIRKTLREINDSFEKLAPQELVPLPGYPGEFVDYRELIGLEQMGEADITIGKLEKKFSVKQLLDGIEREEERRTRGFTGDDPGRALRPLHFEPEPREASKKLDRIKELNRLIDNLGKEIDLKKKQKDLWDTEAQKLVRHRYLWIPAVLMVLIIALYILVKTDIWPWSTVEPDTYILPLLLVPGGLVLLLMKGQPLLIPSAYDRAIEKEKEKLYLRNSFDAAGLERMKAELEQAKKERDSL